MQVNTSELQQWLKKGLVSAIQNDPEAIRAIFKRNGVDALDNATPEQLYASVLKGIIISESFKNDLLNYMQSSIVSKAGQFQSADGSEDSQKALNSNRVGNYLDAAANLLINALGSRMRREGEERAIEFELAQAQRLREEAASRSPFAEGQKRILVPVAIGVSVLFVGFGVYYLINQNKGK